MHKSKSTKVYPVDQNFTGAFVDGPPLSVEEARRIIEDPDSVCNAIREDFPDRDCAPVIEPKASGSNKMYVQSFRPNRKCSEFWNTETEDGIEGIIEEEDTDG